MNGLATGGSRRRDDAGHGAHGRTCPDCNGPTYRVPRHLVDRLISIFVAVRRYRCRSMNCAWEGILREKRQSRPKSGHGHEYERRIYVLDASRMGHGPSSGDEAR